MSPTPSEESRKLLASLAKWCVFRDRSTAEARRKLREIAGNEITPAVEDWILSELSANSFLDDQRFARSYTLGKFRNNKWGRLLIRQGLRKAGIAEELIATALAELPEEEYLNTLRNLILSKARSLAFDGKYEDKEKIFRYASGKGYESDLIFRVMDEPGQD